MGQATENRGQPTSSAGIENRRPVSHAIGTIKVLIATPFEADNAALIAGATTAAEIWYRPDLLPAPRYPGDHEGDLATLTQAQRTEWEDLLRESEVLLGVDVITGDDLPARALRLRWVQGTSSGMTAYLARTGLLRSRVMITTAAGIHAKPLAEWVHMAALYFTKQLPLLQQWQRQHHWERC